VKVRFLALLSAPWLLAAMPALAAQSHSVPARASERTPGPALASRMPAITPHVYGQGSYALRLRLRYLESVTGNVELRRHEYFVDDNLKAVRQRTSVIWSVKWQF
jgi:hypothetical protein